MVRWQCRSFLRFAKTTPHADQGSHPRPYFIHLAKRSTIRNQRMIIFDRPDRSEAEADQSLSPKYFEIFFGRNLETIPNGLINIYLGKSRECSNRGRFKGIVRFVPIYVRKRGMTRRGRRTLAKGKSDPTRTSVLAVSSQWPSIHRRCQRW
jgi:hypothetical protein